MVLLWIGIGLGITLIGVLIQKYVKTPKYDYLKVDLHCIKCGDRTNGFKCPQCEQEKTSNIY